MSQLASGDTVASQTEHQASDSGSASTSASEVASSSLSESQSATTSASTSLSIAEIVKDNNNNSESDDSPSDAKDSTDKDKDKDKDKNKDKEKEKEKGKKKKHHQKTKKSVPETAPGAVEMKELPSANEMSEMSESVAVVVEPPITANASKLYDIERAIKKSIPWFVFIFSFKRIAWFVSEDICEIVIVRED